MNRQNNLKAENPAKEALIVYICSVLNRAGNLRDKPFTNYIGKLTRQVFGARVASVESETVGSIQRENDQSKHEVCCKPPSQRFGLGVSPFMCMFLRVYVYTVSLMTVGMSPVTRPVLYLKQVSHVARYGDLYNW